MFLTHCLFFKICFHRLWELFLKDWLHVSCYTAFKIIKWELFLTDCVCNSLSAFWRYLFSFVSQLLKLYTFMLCIKFCSSITKNN